jgi:hypothetical protein
MAHILNYLINTKKYFNLDNINKRIQHFKFCEVDTGNPIPQIKADHIKKKHIIMSASEMLAFVSYFGILVGDLVPEDDECWQLYVNLHQILYILLSRVISKNTIQHLAHLIEEHHTLHCNLFAETLKPKHHMLLHYPNFILNAGPPRYLWAMRYEAFHKILKSSASVVTSRKNILATLAVKHQLRFSYRIITKKGFGNAMEHGPTDDINSLSDYKAIYNLLKSTLEPSAVPNGGGVSVPWVKSDNILYKIGFALQMSDDEIPKFGVIKHIILINNMINFILQPLFVIGFNCHKQGYEIQFDFENNLPCSWVSMCKNELINKVPFNIHFTGDGSKILGIMQ